MIGETPEKKWYLASVLSVTGCFILLAGGALELDMRGAFFAVCSGLSYSLFSVFAKKLIADFPPFPLIVTIFIMSSFMVIPLLFSHQPVWIMSFKGGAIAGYLGFFATAGAYLLYTGGLQYVNASTAVTLALAEPATAALLGIFLIGERMSLYSFSGVLVIFAGLMYLSCPDRRFRKS